ncbi:hypothetical protein ACSBR1_012299 [Camellia fascicularis]
MYITTYSSAALRKASRTKFPISADLSASPRFVLFCGGVTASIGIFEHAFKGILTGLPKPGGGEFGKFYSLPTLNDPRIAIRNCDNFQVTKEDVEKIIDWENTSPKQVEIPFKLARVLLQDFTGVPTLVDLACMRDPMNKLGSDSNKINPLVPVDLVIDQDQKMQYMQIWSLNSKGTRRDLLFLNGGQMHSKTCLLFLQVLVLCTRLILNILDVLSLTLMGLLAGELEVLKQRQQCLARFELFGKLRDGVTATDLVLTMTQMLRKHGVVGKFVEFYGEGVGKISLADRATIANMSPEYGATMGFFLVDHVALQYLKLTGRSEETVAMIEAYLRANNMFVDYNEPQQERVNSSYLHLDLADVEPCIFGPKRPHDRVPLKEMKADWHSCLDNKVGFNGFAIPKEVQNKVVKFSFHGQPAELNHDIVAAAVLSGYRNFKGRVHPLTRANYLASPPLEVSYALAGTETLFPQAKVSPPSGPFYLCMPPATRILMIYN